MNDARPNGWIARWLARDRSVPDESEPNELFDPHSLNTIDEVLPRTVPIGACLFYSMSVVVPTLALGWFTFQPANFYYHTPYALLLAAIMAGCFLVEASHQFHQLRSKKDATDRPYALRALRFSFATGIYFTIMLVAGHIALRIENYWLHFLAGNYAPYLLQHLLLLAIVFYSWSWYGQLIRSKSDPKDRQPISGRSITGNDEAQRRRKDLFQ